MSGITAIRSQVPDGFLYQPPEWLMDCSFVEENAAGLALGSLDGDEVVRVNHHISWCPNCAKLVHESRKTIGYLPFLSTHAAPSPMAKSRLFDRIQNDQLQTPLLAGTIDHALASMTADPVMIDARPKRSSAQNGNKPGRRFNWEVLAAPLAAVPLVVALAIVGGWALRTQSQLDDGRTQTQVLQHQNEDLSEQVDLLSNSLNSNPAHFDFQSATGGIVGSAGGSVVELRGGKVLNLTVWNLPLSTTSYKVLVETKDGQLQQVESFNVEADGTATLNVELESTLDQYESIHVQPAVAADGTSANDTLSDRDILWTDLNSNLGSDDATEANASAH